MAVAPSPSPAQLEIKVRPGRPVLCRCNTSCFADPANICAPVAAKGCPKPTACNCASIFEPAFKRLVLLIGEGRVKMLDRHLRWGDEDRFGMAQRAEAVLSVVVPHAGRAGATERH